MQVSRAEVTLAPSAGDRLFEGPGRARAAFSRSPPVLSLRAGAAAPRDSRRTVTPGDAPSGPRSDTRARESGPRRLPSRNKYRRGSAAKTCSASGAAAPHLPPADTTCGSGLLYACSACALYPRFFILAPPPPLGCLCVNGLVRFLFPSIPRPFPRPRAAARRFVRAALVSFSEILERLDGRGSAAGGRGSRVID